MAKTAGKYLIIGQADLEQGGVCVRKIVIMLNGTTVICNQAWQRNDDGPTRMNIATIYDLNVGDYVELWILNGDYINTRKILKQDNHTPEFMMQRIG